MTPEQIKKEIDRYYSDLSRTQEDTQRGLEDILVHTENLVAALEETMG